MLRLVCAIMVAIVCALLVLLTPAYHMLLALIGFAAVASAFVPDRKRKG
jgi:hypothetical protein